MRPTLVVNPANDRVFGEFAQLLVEHGAASIAVLEQRLQAIYPAATVHARELAAETIVIWNVYRDGHWVDSRHVAEKSGEHATDERSTGRSSLDAGGDQQRRGAGSNAGSGEGGA